MSEVIFLVYFSRQSKGPNQIDVEGCLALVNVSTDHFNGLVSHYYREFCEYGFGLSGKGAILPLNKPKKKRENNLLTPQDLYRHCIPTIYNSRMVSQLAIHVNENNCSCLKEMNSCLSWLAYKSISRCMLTILIARWDTNCWPLSTVTVFLLYNSRIVSQLAVHIVSMHRGMLLHANQERQLFISLRPEQLFLL